MNRVLYYRIPFIFALILLLSSVIACGKPTDTEISGAWYRSVDYTGIMTGVSPSNDPELYYANEALENNMYVHRSLEPYRYEGEIDWEIGNKTNSWLLWFQSLRTVGFLSSAAEASGDASYLEKAAETIESWFDFHYGNSDPPRYAWSDHAVANRVHNITHFLRAYKRLPDVHLPESLFQKIHTMLHQHATWLLEEKNYHPYNHGMIASIALAQIALTFPEFDDSELWQEVSVARIKERIEADLSEEYVHLEHSPVYHLFFLNRALTAENYLETKGISLFEPEDNTIEDMKPYVAYMVMPNLHLPVVGDTRGSLLGKDYDHPWVMYSLSNGLEGVRPPDDSIVYPDAGIAILRDEWKSGSEFTESTYLMFQAAFHSVYHKHADDLGFVLYTLGEDIFVGPGVYAYGDSKYRQYVTSTQAHNTLTIDGNNYPVIKDNVGKASIIDYCLDEAFDFVQGSHTMYGNASLRRGILLIRPNTILLIDELISTEEHSIQQIFNLAPSAHDLTFDRDGASLLVGDKGVYVEIRQLCSTTSVRHYEGQEEPVRGFISREDNTVVPVHQLEFENHGNGTVFVTQISVTGLDHDIPDMTVECQYPYTSISFDQDGGPSITINLDGVARESAP